MVAGISCTKILVFESERAVALIESGECVEGIGAFLGKREPEFKDG
jgi:hypothetical protein